MPHTQETLKQIFAHPTSHNIPWRDVVKMFEGLGGITEETKKEHLKVKLNGKEMTFLIPRHGHHSLDNNDEIGHIRRFLRDCGFEPAHK